MLQEAEAAIIHLENQAIKKVYVEMVKQVVESEAKNNEDKDIE